jgi:hypothetical protein
MLIGGDYSLYDPVLNWEIHDWEYAFIKVSEGSVPDPRFRAQWYFARGKIIRGAYHFFRPAVPNALSVDRMMYLLKDDPGELPPVLDLEIHDGLRDIPQRAWDWYSRVAKIIGRDPILYTSLGFINSTGGMNAYHMFRGKPIWLAEYPWDKIHPGWTEADRRNQIYKVIHARLYNFRSLDGLGIPDFIQWTAKAPPEFVPGYPLGTKLAVDVNLCRLTMPELFSKYRITNIPPEGELPVTEPNVITLTAQLGEFQPSNLRNAAGLVNTAIRKTMTGPLMIQGIGKKIYKDGYTWIEVVKPDPGFVALTSAYTQVKYNEAGLEETTNTPPTVDRYVVRTKLYYNDGTTQDLP